jgi:hypothetical protein
VRSSFWFLDPQNESVFSKPNNLAVFWSSLYILWPSEEKSADGIDLEKLRPDQRTLGKDLRSDLSSPESRNSDQI